MALKCSNCGNEQVNKKILGIHTNALVKYVEVKLNCNVCGNSEIRKIAKRSPKKLYDEPDIDVKTIVDAAESPYVLPQDEITAQKKEGSKIIGYIKLAIFYSIAIILGIFVQVIGIFVERTMMMLEFPAVIGFTVSLAFFLLAPIIVVGAFVYRIRNKPFEGIFLGALVIPITLFLIIYMRRLGWNYMEYLHEIYDMLLPF